MPWRPMDDPDAKLKILAELTVRAQQSSAEDAESSQQHAHAPQLRVQSKPAKAAIAASRYQASELSDSAALSPAVPSPPASHHCMTYMTHYHEGVGMSPYQDAVDDVAVLALRTCQGVSSYIGSLSLAVHATQEKNRQAQARFRERQKAKQSDTERRMADLEKAVVRLQVCASSQCFCWNLFVPGWQPGPLQCTECFPLTTDRCKPRLQHLLRHCHSARASRH